RPSADGACLSSHVVEVERAIFPKVKPAGNEGEQDGNPFENFREPPNPGVTEKRRTKNRVADGAPLILADDLINEDRDDGDDLGNRFVFAVTFGGKHDIF